MSLLRKIRKYIHSNSLLNDIIQNTTRINETDRKPIESLREISLNGYRTALTYGEAKKDDLLRNSLEKELKLLYVEVLTDFNKRILDMEDTKLNVKLPNSICINYHSFYNRGQNVIKFKNQAMLQQLENTEINNLSFGDFKAEAECMYLELEKKIHDSVIYGVFITQYKEGIELTAIYQPDTFQECRTYTLPLRENVKIEDELTGLLEQFERETLQNGLGAFAEEENTRDKILLDYIIKISVNALFFLDFAKNSDRNDLLKKEDFRMKNPLENNSNANDKYLKKYSKKYADANYYYILGNESQANKDIQERIKRGKIDKSFFVKGHTRKQPIGKKGENKFKYIWIEPFLKGIGKKEAPEKMKITVV